jgi:membrane protein
MERLRELAARIRSWWNDSLPGRVLKRYSDGNGSILASGLAYGLLFAFFAGLWSIVSVFGVIFSNNTSFRSSFLSVLDSVVPGIASGGNSILTESALSSLSTTFTITGVVTLVAFWWKITSWMGSLRSSVQSIIGIDADTSAADDPVAHVNNPVYARLLDTLAVFLVAVLFLLATFAGTLSGGLVSALMRVFGVFGTGWLSGFIVGVVGFVVSVLLNVVLLTVLYRVVCQVRRRKVVLRVSFLGALALSVIQLLGGRLITGASSNPLLAPFAAIVAVLIWFNIVTQVLLYCSAMMGEFVDAD